MIQQNTCIERAGHILISCIWIEKRLIDLIVLKNHPRLIKKVNESSTTNKLPRTFITERAKLWEKDFAVIKNMFVELFEPGRSWEDNLEGIYDWRNMIGHSHISLYRDYLLYRPSGKRRKINRLKKTHAIVKKSDSAKPLILSFRLGDDKKYEDTMAVIIEFDQVYLRSVSEGLGINYEKIR